MKMQRTLAAAAIAAAIYAVPGVAAAAATDNNLYCGVPTATQQPDPDCFAGDYTSNGNNNTNANTASAKGGSIDFSYGNTTHEASNLFGVQQNGRNCAVLSDADGWSVFGKYGISRQQGKTLVDEHCQKINQILDLEAEAAALAAAGDLAGSAVKAQMAEDAKKQMYFDAFGIEVNENAFGDRVAERTSLSLAETQHLRVIGVSENVIRDIQWKFEQAALLVNASPASAEAGFRQANLAYANAVASGRRKADGAYFIANGGSVESGYNPRLNDPNFAVNYHRWMAKIEAASAKSRSCHQNLQVVAQNAQAILANAAKRSSKEYQSGFFVEIGSGMVLKCATDDERKDIDQQILLVDYMQKAEAQLGKSQQASRSNDWLDD